MLTSSAPPFHRRRLGKSVAHAEIQYHLKKQIPHLELEKKLVNRRADAVWEAKKIVFEIQLSPLTKEEAIQRSHDYKTLGYQVVWLLHEKVFNRKEVSPAELFLRTSYPTYYTNGALFYDQIEIIEEKCREYQGSPLPIELAEPFLPFLKMAQRAWPMHFVGDLHTWCARYGVKALEKIDRSRRRPQGLQWWLQFVGFRILELVSRNPK